MFNRLKNRVLTVVAPDMPRIEHEYHQMHGRDQGSREQILPEKFEYSRPSFLQLLTNDELKASADHNVRPIIVPRDPRRLPYNTGYAECVNAGKSVWNEDQAVFKQMSLSHPNENFPSLKYTYFGIFDGHAGYAASLIAANQFHHVLHQRLVNIVEMLLPRLGTDNLDASLHLPLSHPQQVLNKRVTRHELIVGALETAFQDMDKILEEDRTSYRIGSGCTSLVALFILGKLYVANAGDSRAVLCKRKLKDMADEQRADRVVVVQPCSYDHTPESERHRLLTLGMQNQHLLGSGFIACEFARTVAGGDLGKPIVYRDGRMRGWGTRMVEQADLKRPLISGSGKRARLMGTIGVSRGFGDHDLKALTTNLSIKPFLSSHPDVKCFDLDEVQRDLNFDDADGDYGILVMATDGLWDVSEPSHVGNTVFGMLDKFPKQPRRYTMAAQGLVAQARGRVNHFGHWRLSDMRSAATTDDISVFVMPVYQYYRQYCDWKESINIANTAMGNTATGNTATENTATTTRDFRPILNPPDAHTTRHISYDAPLNLKLPAKKPNVPVNDEAAATPLDFTLPPNRPNVVHIHEGQMDIDIVTPSVRDEVIEITDATDEVIEITDATASIKDEVIDITDAAPFIKDDDIEIIDATTSIKDEVIEITDDDESDGDGGDEVMETEETKEAVSSTILN
ncbi:protein phosphatase 1H [Anopheles bellator]|uniref:protein phosphatase 1H n=1 Tax=Anopheles bellator TaxID=139047 RepID=UPI00264932AD|nr:protein phosphatase 1H [Anopheles bellator]